MRPLVGGLVLGVAISVAVVCCLALAGELDAGWQATLVIFAVPIAILAALGALQSAWWSHKLGGVRYEADEATLRVVQANAVVHMWPWAEVHKLRLEGTVGWYSLIALRAGVDDFPHLIVHSKDGITKAPGVLVWGLEPARKIERQLVHLQRAEAP